MQLQQVIKQFCENEKTNEINKIKTGNINNTYAAILESGKKILIQRINKNVFKNPRAIMRNVELTLGHLNQKRIFDREIELLKTVNGRTYYIDSNGDFWRCYNFVNNSETFDNPTNDAIVYQTGKAFGKFSRAFFDFNANKLAITIDNFHNTQKRFEDLLQSAKIAGDRFILGKNEFDFLCSISNYYSYYEKLEKSGAVSLRVTHNDTKCNNVLIDKSTKKAVAVIDLDTVMPGHIAHDFGDGARSISNTASEDERDFTKVSFDLQKFKLFATAFISEVKNYLTQEEKQSLYPACIVITAELAMRFLTDYFIRDKYFKIDYATHNLVRAKNQIELCKDIIKKQEDINEIISTCLS